MQHDHILKKLNFDLLTPSPGSGISVGKIFATMLLHSWFSLIWYATTPCSEKNLFWPTDSIPRVGSVCRQNICYHVSVFVILFNLICNLTMSWKSKILTYWPRFQGRWWGRGVEVFGEQLICYHAAAFSDSLWYATWPCSKKVEFWPNDPIPRVGCVCEQNISYHVAAFVILFNLIYNMTVFWKMDFYLLTPSPGSGCVLVGG